MAARNGKAIWLGIAGTAVAVALGVVTLLGTPSCSELVTQTESDKAHAVIENAHAQDRDAAAELNAAQHAAMQDSIGQSQTSIKENQTEIRWMFKRILSEVKE